MTRMGAGLLTLNLSRCRGLGQGALSSIKSMGKLRSLDCTGCIKLSQSDVTAFGHHPDLLQLSLAACPSIMSAAAGFCSSCPQLAALNLNSNRELTDRQLQAILAAAAALKDLQANGCSHIRSVACWPALVILFVAVKCWIVQALYLYTLLMLHHKRCCISFGCGAEAHHVQAPHSGYQYNAAGDAVCAGLRNG